MFSLNIFLNGKIISLKNLIQKVENKAYFYNSLSESVKFNLNLTYEYQNYLVPDIEVYDLAGKNKQLKKLINRKCLIVRYNEFSCQQCIDSLFVCLNSIDPINCIILGEYRNSTQLGSFYRINQPKYDVFNCKKNILPIDSLNIPYLFVMDTNLLINSFFIPLKEDMQQIETYLNIVSKDL